MTFAGADHTPLHPIGAQYLQMGCPWVSLVGPRTQSTVVTLTVRTQLCHELGGTRHTRATRPQGTGGGIFLNFLDCEYTINQHTRSLKA